MRRTLTPTVTGLISRQKNRWLKIASAYPVSAAAPNRRGINNTDWVDWVTIDRATYDACVDPWDYQTGAPRA